MFVLSSMSSGLVKVFKNMNLVDEISNNLLNDLLGTNICKTIEFC